MAEGFSIDARVAVHRADRTHEQQMQMAVDLLDHYARDPMGMAGPLDPAVKRRLLADLSSRVDCAIYMAWRDNQALGLAICFEGYSTFAARPLMNIHDLVVLESHRRQGIGRMLLEAVEADARTRGCCKVTLEVRQDNPRAMQLYRNLGFGPGEADYLFWSKPL